jgi:hypothetical protein
VRSVDSARKSCGALVRRNIDSLVVADLSANAEQRTFPSS